MSSQKDRGDTQIDPPSRRTGPADSKTATGRGQGGGGALPLPLPLPGRPLPGASRVAGGSARWGGRAQPEAASWLQLRESVAAPEPRVPAWSLRSEQVSAADRASPAGAPLPGVARTFPIPQKGTLRPRGDSALGACFRGYFSWVVLSVLSGGGDGGRLLRMRGRAGDGREEDEPAGQGVSSPQRFGMNILGIWSQSAFRCLAFLICEMKAPPPH